MKKITKLITLFIILFLQEIIFSLITIGQINYIWLKLLFTVALAIVIDILTNIFREKTNKIIFITISVCISLIFIIYDIYYQLIGSVLSIYSIKNGIQAISFSNILIKEIRKKLVSNTNICNYTSNNDFINKKNKYRKEKPKT